MKKAILFVYLILSISFFGLMVFACTRILRPPFTERDFERLFTEAEGIPILFVIFSALTIVYLIKFLSFNRIRLNNNSLDEFLAPEKINLFNRNRLLDISLIVHSLIVLAIIGLFIFLWITEPPPENDKALIALIFAGILVYWFLSLYFFWNIISSSRISHKE